MPCYVTVAAQARRLTIGILTATLLIPLTATAPAQAIVSTGGNAQMVTPAESDANAPGLSSFSRTTPDIVDPNESVRLQWASDATDIDYAYVSFINNTGQTITDIAYSGEDLEITLDPKRTTAGTYRLNHITVYDVTGISTTYYGDGRTYTYPEKATAAPAVNLNLDALTFTVQQAPLEVIPAEVIFTDEDGTAADTYTIPPIEVVEYLIDGEVVATGTYAGTGTVTVTARAAQPGYVLADGATTSWTMTFATTPQQVTPVAVIFADEDGTAVDTYTIPNTEGVDYLVNGAVTAPGTYPGTGTGTVTVTAQAKTDYVFADGADTRWSNTFATTMVVTPKAPVFTDKPSTYTWSHNSDDCVKPRSYETRC
jgi:hypothetical protein